ncbi:hypothetical protein CPB83DRAFT_834109 [Crepidotus variabilis]|uniref:Uncharacterized protein n=1 Tax=Crepidotus variabilis TaxID=179855 RepID=A0A9P6EL24_9AGAR|nr:hypothetical protein CPB83DRAFT_834109 [Crepidotus variabilis]
MGDTYSVGYLPWILDLQSWRIYDPSTIDGVGIIVGCNNGRFVVGDDLKTCRSVTLQPNAPNTSYAWVYTPEGAIFYRLWEHDHREQYVPNNQIVIAGEQPVVCAGEFRIAQAGHLTSVLVLINDVSGYVEKRGSESLGPVAVKLRGLGINLTRTSWYYDFKSVGSQDGR